jgi:hypothetical protein
LAFAIFFGIWNEARQIQTREDNDKARGIKLKERADAEEKTAEGKANTNEETQDHHQNVWRQNPQFGFWGRRKKR